VTSRLFTHVVGTRLAYERSDTSKKVVKNDTEIAESDVVFDHVRAR